VAELPLHQRDIMVFVLVTGKNTLDRGVQDRLVAFLSSFEHACYENLPFHVRYCFRWLAFSFVETSLNLYSDLVCLTIASGKLQRGHYGGNVASMIVVCISGRLAILLEGMNYSCDCHARKCLK